MSHPQTQQIKKEGSFDKVRTTKCPSKNQYGVNRQNVH